MKIETVNPNQLRNRMMRLMASFLMVAITLLTYTATVKAGGLLTISPKQAHALILKEKDNPDFVILDIRTPGEFKSGHIEDAVLIDFYARNFLEKMQALDKNKTYLLYCRSANRSTKTLSLVKNMGFTSLYNMDRGIIGWGQNGFATVK